MLIKIPATLRELNQWVVWRHVNGTKVPFQPDGQPARSNDPATWHTFDAAVASGQSLGFVFREGGGLVGIDLDGCRSDDGVAPWAREIILQLDTYGEVSPSGTGIKLFGRGTLPMGGRKRVLGDGYGKQAAIEVYDRGRYFAVTGQRIVGPAEPTDCQAAIDWLVARYFPAETKPKVDYRSDDAVVDRARKYLAKIPPAVSGSSGHNVTFHAACVLVLGFGLDERDALGLLAEWNASCQPPWSDRELEHKVRSAAAQPGERNYLRQVAPARWEQVKVPRYEEPKPAAVETVTLAQAARKAIDRIRRGEDELLELGLSDVDYAIGGGVERGEYVVLAALPGHCKTAIALQIAHTWTEAKRPVLILSEEMSDVMLGKRTLSYWTGVPKGNWAERIPDLENDMDVYDRMHAPGLIVPPCGTVQRAVEAIEWAIAEHNIQAVFIDYLQMLKGSGASRYEQTTQTSLAINEVRKRHRGIVLFVLAQLKREVETRTPSLQPTNADIKETGQIAQDADVILHMVYPCKSDRERDASEFWIMVGKNRNRETNKHTVQCQFIGHQMRLVDFRPARRSERNFDESVFSTED